jgi:hypothetical protein
VTDKPALSYEPTTTSATSPSTTKWEEMEKHKHVDKREKEPSTRELASTWKSPDIVRKREKPLKGKT